MTAVREKLPNRRASRTFEIEVAGRRHSSTFSNFADGAIAEIFLENHKSGCDAHTAAGVIEGENPPRRAKNGSMARVFELGAPTRAEAGLRSPSGRFWRIARQRR